MSIAAIAVIFDPSHGFTSCAVGPGLIGKRRIHLAGGLYLMNLDSFAGFLNCPLSMPMIKILLKELKLKSKK